AFMICVNELTSLRCNKKAILKPLIILLAPFAPHLAEELWEAMGEKGSVCDAAWPELNEDFLKESTFQYPISFNGKTRFTLELSATADRSAIEKVVLEHPNSQK